MAALPRALRLASRVGQLPGKFRLLLRLERAAAGGTAAALGRIGLKGLRRAGRLLRGGRAETYATWWQREAAGAPRRAAALSAALAGCADRPRFSLLLPVSGADPALLAQAIGSVRAQSYPGWELCIAEDAAADGAVAALLRRAAAEDARIRLTRLAQPGGLAEAANAAMALAGGDYLCLLDAADALAPDALLEFARLLCAEPAVDFLYADEDRLSPAGAHADPRFKPGWSPLLLESCFYTGRPAAYRASLARAIGGFRPAMAEAAEYDFALRFTERAVTVRHLRRVLYHARATPGPAQPATALRALEERCARTGQPALVRPGAQPGCYVARRTILGSPRVSIVIPSAGRSALIRGREADLLATCVRALFHPAGYGNIEVIVVDNGDLRPATRAALAPFPVRFVTYAAPRFNVAAKMNLGAAQASGDFLLFLNDDIEPITPDWLEAMLAVAQRPGVGMVGAKLRFEDGTLQHVGVVLCEGWPDHLRRGFPADDAGYLFSSIATREVAAVTGACALLPAELFRRLGGFDEAFAVNFNDIDLCLRVRATGASIVLSAQAELFHYESRSRVRHVDDRELALWAARWGAASRVDPFYSPILAISPPTGEPDYEGRAAALERNPAG